MADKDLTKKVE